MAEKQLMRDGAQIPRDDLNEVNELMPAKLRLVAAQAHGEKTALRAEIAGHPAFAGALADFQAALLATHAYADVTPTAETQRIAERGMARALAAVFGTQPVAASAEQVPVTLLSLKTLRQERKLSLLHVAQRLGLGVDVLSSLEAGAIRLQSLPERLLASLAATLDLAADQVRDALHDGGALSPALQRAHRGNTSKTIAEQPVLEFAEAVRLSPEMSPEQKAEWLAAR